VARRAVGELGDRIGCDPTAVRTVVSELVGNCVVHAYVDSEPGPVIVVARANGDGFEVIVADEGRGMSPRIDSPGLGLGLPLVGKLAREVRIDSDEDEGATVSVVFDCDPETLADGPSPVGAAA
jgi:serine/threonine-protein kinase RsbW